VADCKRVVLAGHIVDFVVVVGIAPVEGQLEVGRVGAEGLALDIVVAVVVEVERSYHCY
jgi:hypothetical protein